LLNISNISLSLSTGSTSLYPATPIVMSWTARDVENYLRIIKDFREDVFGAYQGVECTPFLTAENMQLYGMYPIDIRGKDTTIMDVSSGITPTVTIQFNSEFPAGYSADIYSLFIGSVGFEIGSLTTTELY
jgi:hypothetical protein